MSYTKNNITGFVEYPLSSRCHAQSLMNRSIEEQEVHGGSYQAFELVAYGYSRAEDDKGQESLVSPRR